MVDITVKKMKANLANLITLGNISFGGAALMATIYESYGYAVLFILIAALLDRYDGKVARKYNLESELGKQLDSMSDIISFGVAPAVLMYEVELTAYGNLGMVIAVLYIACGAFRLARFNVTESNGYFTGLPITAAGAILTISFFFSPWLSTAFYVVLFPLLAILMISNFSLKKV